jgi:hypothetical protein
MTTYFTYVRQLRPRSPFGWPALGCTIHRDGECIAFASWGDDDRPELGTYAMRTEVAWVDRFWQRMQACEHATLAAEPPALSTPIVALGEGTRGQPPELTAFPVHALPHELHALIAELDAFIDTVREHPHHVVRGAVSWREPTAGVPLRLEVSLVNPGPNSASFPNPALALPDAGATLTLHRDVGEAPFDAEHDAATLVLGPDDFAPAQPQGSGVVLLLEPGQSAAWTVERAAYLEPGRYRAWLSLHFRPGVVEPSLAVDGTLSLPVGLVQINP